MLSKRYESTEVDRKSDAPKMPTQGIAVKHGVMYSQIDNYNKF